MTTPPGGPNVPPPPAGPYGQAQAPGQFPQQGGQPAPYAGSGQAYGGPPGGFGGPGSGGPGGQPPKKGPGKGLIAGIAGGIVLVLLLCCIGGFFVFSGDDDDSSSSTTSQSSTESSTTESTTESSTTEPTESSTTESSTSSSSAAAADFPEEFDGWKKGTTSDAGGQSTAVYRKGSDTISVVVSDTVKPSDFEAIWDDDEKVGEVYCGTLRSTTQCAGDDDGQTVLVTTVTTKTAKEVAKIVTDYLDAD